MKFRNLGKIGIHLSEIGIGTWKTSGDVWGKKDGAVSLKTLLSMKKAFSVLMTVILILSVSTVTVYADPIIYHDPNGRSGLGPYISDNYSGINTGNISCDSNFVTITKIERFSGYSRIWYTVKPNYSRYARSAYIKVKKLGITVRTYTIQQEAAYIKHGYPYEQTKSLKFPLRGGKQVFEVEVKPANLPLRYMTRAYYFNEPDKASISNNYLLNIGIEDLGTREVGGGSGFDHPPGDQRTWRITVEAPYCDYGLPRIYPVGEIILYAGSVESPILTVGVLQEHQHIYSSQGNCICGSKGTEGTRQIGYPPASLVMMDGGGGLKDLGELFKGGRPSEDSSIVWPDPIGNPDPQDFYLVSPEGGNRTVTHNAWKNADMYYSQPWIVDGNDNGSQATFRFEPNNTTSGRDGSVRAQIGTNVVECIRYLQCAPAQTYTVALPAWGGSETITLPYGYQYIEYGALACGSKAAWIGTPKFTQNAKRMPSTDTLATVTLSADAAYTARNGQVAVTMGNTRDGTYTVAYINVTQEALPIGTAPGNTAVTAPYNVDYRLVPADGGNYVITYSSMTGSTVVYTPEEMFINRVYTNTRSTFTVAPNSATNGREGNVYSYKGAYNQRLYYLQCGQVANINVTIPPGGGKQTISLPNGYQLTRYGKLVHPYHPDWITGVSFTQGNGSANATVDITASSSTSTRVGVIPIYFGNTSNGTFQIATLNLTQSVPNPVAPIAVWLDQASATMELGDTLLLSATISPAGTQNKTIIWTSSNTSVATVSDDGVVTTVSEGTATITAKTVNGLTAVCTVTVKNPIVPISTDTSHLHFDASTNATDDGVSLQVENGGSYSVSASSWLHYDMNGSELSVTCDGNASDQSRLGTITIRGENGSQTVVTVKQSGTSSISPAMKGVLLEALELASGREVDLERASEEDYEAFLYAFYAGIMVFGDEYALQATVDTATTDLYEALKKLIILPSTVTVSPTSKTLNIGNTAQLSATVTPNNSTDKSVTWSSDKTSVATVSSTGLVTAKAAGTATITVKTNSGNKTAVCKITVSSVAVTTISLSNAISTMIVGNTRTLTANITPANAANKAVTWSSSNAGIAKVDQTGKVTALSAGQVTIKATAKDGSGKSGSVAITVHQYVTMQMGKTTAIQNGNKTTIDDVGAKPFKINGKTMLPLRFVGEKMGCTVKYVSDSAPITITYRNTKAELYLNKKTLKVIDGKNSRTINLEVAAQKRNGRTYLPLRAISQALGFDVFYQSGTEYIVVNNPKMTDAVRNERLAEAKKVIK